jgi:hypothetical protein
MAEYDRLNITTGRLLSGFRPENSAGFSGARQTPLDLPLIYFKPPAKRKAG